MWTPPVFLAVYLLGTEVFAVKVGYTEPAAPSRPLEGGGGTGSHQIGFVMGPDPVVVHETMRRAAR